MSRHKARQPFQHPETIASPSVRFPLWMVELAAVLILAGIPFGLGKFFEFNQPDPFDGGAYTYSAWHLHQGGLLWKDEFASAQPATLFVNYLGVVLFGFSETGPEIIQMLLQMGALGLLFYTARTCFGKIAAQLSTAVAAIYLCAPLIAKYGNVKEQYMIAFMVMTACCLMLAMRTQKIWLWTAAGAAVIWPFYFKPTGMSIITATGFFLVLLLLFKRLNVFQFAFRLVLLAAGAVIGILPLAFFLYQKSDGHNTHLGGTTPVLLIVLALITAGIICAVKVIQMSWQKYQVTAKLKAVPKYYWKFGLIAIGIMHIAGILIVWVGSCSYHADRKMEDLGDYLMSTPLAAMPYQVFDGAYSFAGKFWKTLKTNDVYLTGSRQYMGIKEQAPIVLRYYGKLNLPITLALLSIGTAVARLLLRWRQRNNQSPLEPQDWLVWFLAAWWILDMALVWVSPRSYEQYYLPMCASAATLSGYAVWHCMENWNPVRTVAGKFICPAALLVFVMMVSPVFAGITHSAFSGQAYGTRTYGYAQRWDETQARLRGLTIQPWETLGDYIRNHSETKDQIYVWGWYPGIYVKAQRLSPAPKAFESQMHIYSPTMLGFEVGGILQSFEKNPPRFIVDARKREFPWKVPPLELWPQVPKELAGSYPGFLSTDPQVVRRFEASFSAFLKQQLAAVSPEEYLRFETMKPLRDYVMQHYKIVGVYGNIHVLFERKPTADMPADTVLPRNEN